MFQVAAMSVYLVYLFRAMTALNKHKNLGAT